jgi:hypothetical protein
MKDSFGRDLFLTISIGLACATCLENGLQCNHLKNKLPHWYIQTLIVLFITYTHREMTRLLFDDCDMVDVDYNGVIDAYDRKPSENQDKVAAILASDANLADRETRGVVTSNRIYLFDKSWINALYARPLYEFGLTPSLVWIAIDPSGGGNQSDFAMTSIAYDSCRHIVSLTCVKALHTQTSCDSRTLISCVA